MTTTSNNINSSVTIDKIIEIAQIVVSKYVSRSVIPKREKEDVVMAIVEKFINQKKKIDSSFEGKSKITTYYTAILNRMCCEIVRKENKHWYAIIENDDSNNHEESTHTFETEKESIIKNEIIRLQNTLTLLNGEKAKTVLFLKYYFNIPISNSELNNYCHNKASNFLKFLERDENISKADIFENLAILVNEVESKTVKGDAIRMWLNKQIDLILMRLNSHGTSSYTKESLSILIEHQDAIMLN